MGLLDKFMGKVNPNNNDDYEDSYVFDGADEENNGQNQYAPGPYDTGYQMQPVQGGNMQMNNNMNMGMGGYQQVPQYGGMPMQNQQMTIDSSSLELKVVRPENTESVFQIADHLLNGRTVVLNLEATNGEDQRRMIDFLSGVSYSIDGTLRKVAYKTYVITPNNVDVSADGQDDQGQQQGPQGMQNPQAQQNANGGKNLFSDI